MSSLWFQRHTLIVTFIINFHFKKKSRIISIFLRRKHIAHYDKRNLFIFRICCVFIMVLGNFLSDHLSLSFPCTLTFVVLNAVPNRGTVQHVSLKMNSSRFQMFSLQGVFLELYWIQFSVWHISPKLKIHADSDTKVKKERRE